MDRMLLDANLGHGLMLPPPGLRVGDGAAQPGSEDSDVSLCPLGTCPAHSRGTRLSSFSLGGSSTAAGGCTETPSRLRPERGPG